MLYCTWRPSGLTIGLHGQGPGFMIATDKQTDRPCYSICSNRPQLADAVMWPNNHYRCYKGGYLEGTHQRLVNTHHGAGVVKLSTVVRRREQRHQLTLGKELIAVFYHLSIKQTTHRHTTSHMSIKQSNHSCLYHLSISDILVLTKDSA